MTPTPPVVRAPVETGACLRRPGHLDQTVCVTWPPAAWAATPIAPITGRPGLYDLAADPIEAYNRWTDPQLHELRQHLRNSQQVAVCSLTAAERGIQRFGAASVGKVRALVEAAIHHQVGPVPDRPAYGIGHPGTEPAHGAVRSHLGPQRDVPRRARPALAASICLRHGRLPRWR